MTDNWIKLCDKSPTLDDGEKVLTYRILNSSQSQQSISIFDTIKVKHCDPNETWWQRLPNSPTL